MIYKWSWGIALVLVGVQLVGIVLPYNTLLLGIALIVAGVAFILNK